MTSMDILALILDARDEETAHDIIIDYFLAGDITFTERDLLLKAAKKCCNP